MHAYKNSNPISTWPAIGRTLALVILVIGSLSGCASDQPMRIALTELGTTSNSEYGAYGMRMIRAVSVTGLGPEEVVGTMTTDPDKWSISEQLARFKPNRNDLPDMMTPRLISGQSMIIERRFCKRVAGTSRCAEPGAPIECVTNPALPGCKDQVTMSDLTDLRDSLQKYQANIAEVARAELKREVLAASSAALKDGNATTKAAVLKSLQELYPEDNLKDAAAVESLANTAPASSQADANAEMAKTQKILSKSGIIVTNWERDVAASGSVQVADAVSAGGASTKKVGGFLILGDPRITSLYFGDDLVGRNREPETTASGQAASLFKTHRNYITYYQLRAKYVVFAETYHSSLRATLTADISAITQKLSPLLGGRLSTQNLAAITAKVDALYAAVSAAAGSGVLDASRGEVQEYPFSFLRTGMRGSLEKELVRARDTLPVISIRATLDEVIKSAIRP
jgi:hypothetical protein